MLNVCINIGAYIDKNHIATNSIKNWYINNAQKRFCILNSNMDHCIQVRAKSYIWKYMIWIAYDSALNVAMYHSSPQICLLCLRWHLHLALSSERMTDWLVRKQSFRPSGIFSVHKYYRKQLFVYPKTLHKKNIYARCNEFLFFIFW